MKSAQIIKGWKATKPPEEGKLLNIYYQRAQQRKSDCEEELEFLETLNVSKGKYYAEINEFLDKVHLRDRITYLRNEINTLEGVE